MAEVAQNAFLTPSKLADFAIEISFYCFSLQFFSKSMSSQLTANFDLDIGVLFNFFCVGTACLFIHVFIVLFLSLRNNTIKVYHL